MKHSLRTMLGVVVVLVLVVSVALAKTKVNPKDGAVMVWIPEGKFLMGSADADDKAGRDEKPQHTVYLDGYWIYKMEVTVAQYKAYCAATGEKLPKLPTWSKNDHPVVNVSWSQARAYCKWAGGRLPSEAQWEKAARGTDGRKYPWGNAWDPDKCNNQETGPLKTIPVGSFPKGASPYGCLDMAGNVWEWCEDWYSDTYYKKSPARNPTGPDSGVWRVERGGFWGDYGDSGLRAAFRAGDTPAFRGWRAPLGWLNMDGFRCCQGR